MLDHASPRLSRKSKRFVGTIALLFSLCLLSGKKSSLHPTWPVAPRTLSMLSVAWTVMTSLDDVPQNKNQKVATGLLLDWLHEQNFAGPLSLRASKVLGPISRYRVADILPHMKLASRASRPGLAVGIPRILCNGLCTPLRFHTEEHDHTCRVGSSEPDSLSHCNECPRLYNTFTSFLETCHSASTGEVISMS